MSRYIEAEQFKRDNERLLHCDFPYKSEETLEELIDNAPAADVVEVVRCKDCKHHGSDSYERSFCSLAELYDPVAEDHYCGYGERKDG